MPIILIALIALLSLNLSGCMVGPDFHTPGSPQVKKYNANKLPSKTATTPLGGQAGIAQVYATGRDIPADWWEVFQSQEINNLVQRGIANSPVMTSAQATLQQAQETLYAQIGNLMLPGFNAGISGERQLFPGETFPGSSFPSTIFNTFSANVSVSYLLDVFGGSRREIESLKAQVDYQQFQLVATYLTLTTNIVTTAITMASYDEQIIATKDLIQAASGQLDIIKKQYKYGGVPNTNVLSQQTLLEQARATLPPLEKSLSQTRHALAVLIGETPDKPMPRIHLNRLKLARTVPVSIPSNLVRQRPDVRAAEALLHSATAQVGVATANLFPQFNITGAYGWSGNQIPNLFSDSNKTWNLLTQITQPLFHGGALIAQRRAALAALDVTAAQYKQTVLLAFRNVADALRAIETDARAYRDQRSAEIAAYRNYKITAAQYKDGGVSYTSLLEAQQQYQQTRISSIQAQAMRYTDTASLYQALGGGWWNRPASRCDAVNRINASLHCP